MFKLLRALKKCKMEELCIYKGLGMYEDASTILHRSLTELADTSKYKIDYVTPEQIQNGRLQARVVLLAIGGGYDLGLIQALGQLGMDNIRDFVHRGGSYLGFCSGAYFACDRIEFDKGGPLEVVGDRALKFFPGLGKGPLFKPYDYKTRSGSVAAKIDFTHSQLSTHCNKQVLCSNSQPVQDKSSVCNHDNINDLSQPFKVKDLTGNGSSVSNGFSNHFQCNVFFNGGGYFEVDKTDEFKKVTILSRYLDLPDKPPAVVKCQCGKGVAVLSGPHIEYDAADIDGDPFVADIVPDLVTSMGHKRLMFKCLLQDLNISTKHLVSCD